MSDTKFKTGHVVQLFGITPNTVMNWVNEFEQYLSADVSPGKGRHRMFTESDLEVLALVAEMKSHGFTYDDVHVSLQSGERGVIPDEVPDLPEFTAQLQLQRLENQLVKLQRERDAAIKQVRPLYEENIRLKTLNEEYRKQYLAQREQMKATQARMQKRIEQLLTQMAYLRGMMARKKNQDTP